MPPFRDHRSRPHASTAHRAQRAGPRHAQKRSLWRAPTGSHRVAVAGLGVLSAALALALVVVGTTVTWDQSTGLEAQATPFPAPSNPASILPAPTTPAPALCELAAVQSALATGAGAGADTGADTGHGAVAAPGTAGAVIAAAGGPTALRSAVWRDAAPCIALDDPSRVWAVINKNRPFVPLDYTPRDLVPPEGVQSLRGHPLRVDAAAALSALARASIDSGAGEIALLSGYRSFATQDALYLEHEAQRGTAGADAVSAHAGHSEHQSGLAGDVVACAAVCGGIDDLAATAQGAWLREHAWEFGWIVRYEAGYSETTGYAPEPWHLRFIGVELASAYHYGGFHTLEDFFGLEPAPDYAD